MRKRSSTPKLDTVQNALRVVRESTGQEPATVQTILSDAKLRSKIMAEMGRRGGQVGGKRRLETMTTEQRRKVASKAAKTRWAAYRKAAKAAPKGH